MELLHIEFLGRPLRLEGSLAGWQQLYWDNTLVSQIDAKDDDAETRSHQFKLSVGEDILLCQLDCSLMWQPFELAYRLTVNSELISEGSRNEKDIERQVPTVAPSTEKRLSLIGLVSLGMKALKSAKVIKVALASASLAAYSWLFSIEFALALVACLVFHEYGHIRAMKYFGMKTKGIYLIPFFGGLALSDEKINTRWQDVVISIMGPFFGLVLSLVFTLLYWMTGEVMFAGLAVFNALLNLFNLLPILPLDGGHILKSITFSMNTWVGLAGSIVTALLGIALSYSFGLTLLGFLLLMGMLEVVMEWKARHHSHLLPLTRYGQLFSFVWYLVSVGGFVAIIWYFATLGDSLLSLPLQILGT
ncbi:Zn-dependent protease [Vibrio sp. ES.051]|uniref:site-2 protease family protein n=1 Tax=Vibrio sp. ES.051 TaxID=1761909 RepID=UPI000BF6BFD0|nr:site-2 protease family protein [Vibrio sp. ES.051]PFG58244.1 Zn-dependent protease [Vibrio sp. ES.051]